MFEFLVRDFSCTEHIARSILSSLPYYILLMKLNGHVIWVDSRTVSVTTDVTMLGGSSWAVSELTNKTAVDGKGLSTISIISGR